MIGNLIIYKANHYKKKKSKGIALNVKPESIERDTDFEIDHKIVVNFAKCFKIYFLRLMIQPPLTRKGIFQEIKLKPTKYKKLVERILVRSKLEFML